MARPKAVAKLANGSLVDEPTIVEEEATFVGEVLHEEAEVEEVKETEVEKEEESGVIFNSEETEKKPPEVKNVKVILNQDHSCAIGGIRYNFIKGKLVSVPIGVKEILKRANLLAPL